MKDIFFDLSVRSVRLNFLRSLLASVGIVIGVVAISSMGMLGANMQLSVKEQLSSNVNTIMISSDVVRTTTTAGTPVTSSGITKTQLSEIKSSAGSNIVIPLHRTSTQFTIGSTDGRGSVYGMDPNDIPKFLTIEEGDNIRGANDAIVGSGIASNFDLKVGSRIKIGQKDEASRPVVRVSGILAARGFASDGVNTDNAIIVPDDWYTDHYGDKDLYDQVNVIVKNVDTISDVEASIDDKVNRKSDVVRIQDASSRLTSITATLGTITTFILAIGGISLVVAAVSIFNVMMMSVNERVQEIGILLSIGTEKGEVRRMFLYEAFILGVIGAGVGGICSLVIGYSVVSAMIGNTAYFFLPDSIMYVPYGMIIGIVVCVVSGLYPAWKASNMDPIDALRSE
ncbi:MAG: ABC transporter permease [Methanomicrobiales archaeon HGW-Methanomicrobiales-1]|jgi:putative ABC transport system permease protein|nr:MAG: ABC transporter permease [Methanomicrobiales archaeon HGW-Methanomicrobiales-1]